MEMVGHDILSAIVGATCTITSCAIAIGLPLSMGAGPLRAVVDRRLCVARQCVQNVESSVNVNGSGGYAAMPGSLSCFLLNLVNYYIYLCIINILLSTDKFMEIKISKISTAPACSNTALKVVVVVPCGTLYMYGHVSFVHQKSLAGRLDVAFNLCPGTEVLEAQNDFPVTLKLSLSQDGMYFVHLGHLRPGRSSWNFRANYVRIQWTRTKELLVDAPRGILGLFGHPCLDTTNLTLPEGEWHLPQVAVQPQNCFATALSKHCCHPLRPQCWGYNTLLAMACCAVPFEKSTATCLVSNSKFPNSNQDCRGRPVNYFRTFGDGNELRLLVGGRIWQRPPAEINASLSIGCLFQSVVYLFHELHHLSRDAAFLNAMSSQQLYLYVRLFQADRWHEGSADRQVTMSALKRSAYMV